jgi:phosphatidylinositol-3-phosphatase
MAKLRAVRFLSLILGGLLSAVIGASCNNDDSSGHVSTAAAHVKHVFVIVLENKSFSDTFGTSTQDPYLLKTLVPMGGLLKNYYGTGHVSLDNYISMISGQASTTDTQFDCLPPNSGGIGKYIDVAQTGITSDGQVIATGGCIYSTSVKTLPDQMQAAGLTWKGYMEDMGNDPAREAATCGHPPLNGNDITNVAEAPSATIPLGDQYATRHNPFMYFHSIIDGSICDTHVVNLQALDSDLGTVATTPNLVFVTPNLCNDGHDGDGTGAAGKGCANGQPGGLTSADQFLKTWVPKIMASPAYQQDGLLIITFDEGGSADTTTSTTTDPSTGQSTVMISLGGATCCGQQMGPNISRPYTVNLVNSPKLVENLVYQGYGGDQVGALLISPFVKPGTTSDTGYNHYSLLKSLEDIYGIGEHLGYAADNPSANYVLDTISNDSNIFGAR